MRLMSTCAAAELLSEDVFLSHEAKRSWFRPDERRSLPHQRIHLGEKNTNPSQTELTDLKMRDMWRWSHHCSGGKWQTEVLQFYSIVLKFLFFFLYSKLKSLDLHSAQLFVTHNYHILCRLTFYWKTPQKHFISNVDVMTNRVKTSTRTKTDDVSHYNDIQNLRGYVLSYHHSNIPIYYPALLKNISL